MQLLSEDDPAPFRVLQGKPQPAAESPYLVICDHAGCAVPRALGSLGLDQRELERHIGWDLGAAQLAQRLGQELGAWVILQTYSRLVIDCNRPLGSSDSIAQSSEDTTVPGNRAVSVEQAQQRAQAIFEPYHARIRRELTEREARGQTPILIFLHSFTPVFRGIARPCHAAVLYHRDRRIALPLLRALRAEPELVIGDNEPYAATAATDYGLVEHAERRGLPHVELEIRQDLLADEPGLDIWAKRLARLLRAIPIASL
ncbi:MAG TPA: N-formylglutamate amidohydrolase [Polyangiaceae bacterium]